VASILAKEDAFAQDRRSNNKWREEVLKRMDTNPEIHLKINMTLMNLPTNKRFHVNEGIP
jgi:hypothetical protein